jgi:hypothetical protein
MQDAQAARAYYAAGGDPGTILGNPGTDFAWGGGGMARAWPANPARDVYQKARTSLVETLLVSGTLDMTTPPAAATDELLPFLPNSHQVVLAEFGHALDFWTHQQGAGTRLITTFFESGEVDDTLYTHRSIDFTPDVTDTALAKGLAGTMVGLSLTMVVSLLWMARRVHRRGRLGRKASVMLRSLYAVVLGLGGWFLGVLIVITMIPGVPVDDELLAALSVGVPIGLGVYLAWVNHQLPSSTRTIGLVAAVAGALVGAWLGFNATEGLVALVTAIVGSAVGANLLVILLDIAEDRSERRLGRPVHPFHGARVRRRAREERSMRLKRGLAAVVLALGLAACVSTGVDTYEEFRSALERGAPCSELIDQRDGLSGVDREKATADLEEMGCVEQARGDENG